MPTYKQRPANSYSQRSSNSKTDADMARALIARIQSAQPAPNAMVSGRVVPINPLGVALNTFSEGMANSQLSDAENEQAKIEDDRRNALAQALSNGGKVTPQTLADNGASADDMLKFALAQEKGQQGQPKRNQWYIENGSKHAKNPDTGAWEWILPNGDRQVDMSGMNQNQAALQNPAHRAEIAGAVKAAQEGQQLRTIETENGPQLFTTGSDNPYVDAIHQNESGGSTDPNLRSYDPNSTATGGYQINNATRKDWGVHPGSPFEQDQAAVQRVQSERADKYASQAIAAASHALGEGRLQEILGGATPKPQEAAYLGNLVFHVYKNANGQKPGKVSQPQGLSMQQKEQVKAGIDVEKNKQQLMDKARIDSEEKQRAADVKMLEGDPQRAASYATMQKNSQDYLKNLSAYKDQVGGNPLLNNNLVYNFRAALGTDENIANMESQTQSFVQDQIKAMQAMGLSPSQMLNTETEAKRFMQSVAGNGNADAKINAFNRYKSAKEADMQAFEESRKAASKRLGVEYQPLVVGDIQKPVMQMPGAQQENKQPPTLDDLLTKYGSK